MPLEEEEEEVRVKMLKDYILNNITKKNFFNIAHGYNIHTYPYNG